MLVGGIDVTYSDGVARGQLAVAAAASVLWSPRGNLSARLFTWMVVDFDASISWSGPRGGKWVGAKS